MISTRDPRRTLYDGASEALGAGAAAALIEILTYGPDPAQDAERRWELRRDLEMWEQELASRRSLARARRQFLWVCALSPVAVVLAVVAAALAT